MSDEKVLLDLYVAESIFKGLSATNKALKGIGKSARERSGLLRDMVKLKVAIDNAKRGTVTSDS